MRSTLLAFAAAFACQTTAAWHFETPRSSVNYTGLFEPGLSSGATIYYPSQSNYNTSTVQRASSWEPPNFAVTIKVATEADIQYIIKTANKHQLPFFATGGGHGNEIGFGGVKQAVNIDLSNLTQNELYAANNTLTIGPGISFVDFETNLYKAGKIIPTGNAFCVNMIGATIGAGVGPFQGLYGLIIDSLLSVRLVDANGDVVTASETENCDLFWTIRGAGANFGVITSATYKVYDSPNNGNLVGAVFAFEPSANLSLWNLLHSFDKTYPKEMGMTIEGGYNHTTNESTLLVSMSYVGTQEQAQPTINKFLALKPVAFLNQTVAWSNLRDAQGFEPSDSALACVKGAYANHFAIGTNQTDVATYLQVFNEFAAWVKERPWYEGFLSIQRFNTEVGLAVPKDKQGVYPGRQLGTLYSIENTYDGPVHDDEVYTFSKQLRSQLAATSGFGKLETYINYGFGDEGPAVWYGEENLPRLVALKKQWDPNNRFGPGNPIPESL